MIRILHVLPEILLGFGIEGHTGFISSVPLTSAMAARISGCRSRSASRNRLLRCIQRSTARCFPQRRADNHQFETLVSRNWGPFFWVSLEQQPHYLGSRLGPLIFGNSEVDTLAWHFHKASVLFTCSALRIWAFQYLYMYRRMCVCMCIYIYMCLLLLLLLLYMCLSLSLSSFLAPLPRLSGQAINFSIHSSLGFVCLGKSRSKQGRTPGRHAPSTLKPLTCVCDQFSASKPP